MEWEWQAVVAHLPHGGSFLVRRWLADGTPEMVAADHDHAIVRAFTLQLRDDCMGHVPWISALVCLVPLPPKTQK